MPGEPPAVECRELSVNYGRTPALEAVTLTVARGELVAVLGASGSGKSTLLHAIAGLVPPARGEVWLSGRCVATRQRCDPAERRDIGLVFQNIALWPHLTALDTVAYPLRRARHSRRDSNAQAQQLLERLGIGHLADRRPGELSGGQQQRVGLARALARSPVAFLLDEPTAHLDTHLRAAFQASVRDRRAETGAAALYATHDASEALALADRVAVLVDGRMVQVGVPELVYAEPVSAAAAELTGAFTVVTATVAAAGPAQVSVDLGSGPMIVAGGGLRLGPDPVVARVLLRPDWVVVPGEVPGRVVVSAFRGAHTDYQFETDIGAVHAQLPGPPRLAVGAPVTWGFARAWVLPVEAARRAEPIRLTPAR
ncbi:MAG TPA: ABC transporter ATP-binding protein [Jatrophihabitans sp.]|nr:ABC transporter ATP-binding protein [Jatrophihabitans sp.]